jgi:hypothetical protein
MEESEVNKYLWEQSAGGAKIGPSTRYCRSHAPAGSSNQRFLSRIGVAESRRLPLASAWLLLHLQTLGRLDDNVPAVADGCFLWSLGRLEHSTHSLMAPLLQTNLMD